MGLDEQLIRFWTPAGFAAIAVTVFVLGAGALKLVRSLRRALRTWPALALTPALSRRLSRWVSSLDLRGEAFFAADGVSAEWAARRKASLERLAGVLEERSKKSRAFADGVRDGLSDLRFADANRVPFPFAREMRKRFELCTAVTASEGPRLLDLDGHWTLDVGGSYGVNVAGYDTYKGFIERAWQRVRELGPVLGPIHPLVADNIARLKQISGCDEVSFHASGTEAVMAAVRLARFNTGRKLIVSFSGAYHGWWDGVQPGIGSEREIGDCLTLKDLHPASLEAIRARAHEIAAVLVNPVQCFHANSPPPNDAVLMTSEVRKTESSSKAYGRWLRALREVCTASSVPLIFDEVYSGFRLAPGGAQEMFDVRADFVLYGKTLGGGLPVGVVCGRRELMRRFDPQRPMRLAYVVGTFSAHPFVMAAMNEFLRWVEAPAAAATYQEANERCREWALATNHTLARAGLPIEVAHLGTVWTVLFREPGRYHWLLQYYLRAQGLTLSWVGTGRCLVSLDFAQDDFAELSRALVAASREMRRDGWWPREQDLPNRSRKLRLALARDLAASLIPLPLRAFYAEVMQRKRDDHEASHHDSRNQALHLFSSSVFLCSYALLFQNLTLAMGIGLPALFVRQIGHAIFEPPCHDKEKLLLGFTTRSKTLVVAGYLAIPVIEWFRLTAPRSAALGELIATVATDWFVMTLAVVLGHVAYLIRLYDFRSSMLWLVKLVTDPLTDIAAYAPQLRHRG